MKLSGVEEDDERIGSWGFDGSEITREGLVVETDYAGFGSRLLG